MVYFNCPLDASIITWKECLNEGARSDWCAGASVGDCLDQLLINLKDSVHCGQHPSVENRSRII